MAYLSRHARGASPPLRVGPQARGSLERRSCLVRTYAHRTRAQWRVLLRRRVHGGGYRIVQVCSMLRHHALFCWRLAAVVRRRSLTDYENREYRPNPRNFEYAVAQLRAEDPTLERDQILVVAQSLQHDHVPALALGLSSVWIDRPDAVTCIDGDGVPKDRAAKEVFTRWRFRDLGEFANAVEEARVKFS